MAWRPDDSLIFRAVLETAFDNIYVVDCDLRYTHVSRGGAEALGLTPEKMIGIPWLDRNVEPELMKRVESDLRHVIETGEVLRREVPYETMAGRRYFEYAASPLRSGESTIAGAFVISRDVTARVVAEQELRRVEERYRSFIDHSSEGIWRFEFDEPIDTSFPPDEQIRLMFERAYLAECNDALAQMYGFERADELVGARLHQMLDPAEDANWDYLRAVIAGGYRLDNAESVEVDRFGRRKYFVNSLAAVVEDGRVVRGWGVQRDITDHKAAINRLRLSEERLQALVRASAQVVWTTDANGRLEWISDSWTELTGQTHKEAKGVGWLEMLHPGDRARSEQLWQHAIESHAVYDNVVRIRTRDGNDRWYRVRGAPVFNDDGSVREWVGSTNDVDAERQQELNQSADQIRAEFIAAANDLFVRSLDYEETLRSLVRLTVPRLADWCAVDMVADGSLRRLAVQHVDPAKIRLAFELQERYPPDMNAPHGAPNVVRTGQTEFMAVIGEELLEAVAQDEEHLHLIRQLQLRSYICTPIRVRDEVAGVLTLVIAESERTFTARDVELAEALALRAGHAVENARLYQQAVQANRAKDEFLATLSHELRTPLTAILGWANLLRLASYDPETVRGAMETIERSAKTQAAIIDDLLDVSRIITGKFQINPAAVDIVPIVRSVVESARPAAEGKRLKIEVNAPDSLVVRADSNRLQQIVWNLTSNAVKFSDEGGRIDVAVEREGDDAVIRVTDEGVGISPEILPRVFDRFWQADSSTNRTYGGLGLGLAIVKHLTEMHGGTVAAKSEGAGRGASFIITLPLGDVQSDQAATPAARRNTLRRVLLVDDDASAREVVTKMLEHFGARVTAVGTADDAADLVRNEKFDVILTDVAMPEHDGYWLLERIRATQPGVHVAAITALGVGDAQISAAGFDSFVRKPVDPAKLGELLDRTAAV